MVSDDELARRIEQHETVATDEMDHEVRARMDRLEESASAVHDELARRLEGKADAATLAELGERVTALEARLSALEEECG